jgi:hypothetical protein
LCYQYRYPHINLTASFFKRVPASAVAIGQQNYWPPIFRKRKIEIITALGSIVYISWTSSLALGLKSVLSVAKKMPPVKREKSVYIQWILAIQRHFS